ncbi:MAG: hypothetical protein XU11_C0020G0041 [Candidatus Dadabacteria bacterium CSP1-2]|jgi:hypothetical protein|nr:MAG: hypothetical protein XU11_C0020G0041 [Candidatus Dadabacteria bacterium CSP1-2]
MGESREFRDIVLAFGDVLEREDAEELTLVPSALPESLLPFPKGVIRHAIAQLLLRETSPDKRSILEEAYLYLDNFISDQEYKLFYPLDTSIRDARTDNSDDPGRVEEIISKNTQLMQIINEKVESMKLRNAQANEELRSLRRIIGLPDERR